MNAPSLSLDPAARSRKIETLILQGLAPRGTQAALAVAMGVTEPDVSKIKSQIPALAQLIAHLGLKVVPADLKCYRPEQVDFMFQLFKSQVERASSADDLLIWEDPE